MAEDDFGLDDAILSAAEDLLKETDGIDESEGAAHGGEAGAAGTGSGFRDVPIAPSQHKPAPRREGSDDIEVLVSNPTKVGEGMNSFMQYDITTRTNLPGFGSTTLKAVRRFRDFSWLHNELERELPGAIVPPLPEKSLVRGAISGRFTDEFVEGRRRALEKFINRVAAHPDLRATRVFRTFLEADPSQLVSTREAVAAQQRSAGKGFMQWFGETVTSISQSLSNVEVPKTEADMAFDDAQGYIAAVEPQMAQVHKHAAAMVRREGELATAYRDFGLAATRLAQAEEGGYGRALAQLGHTADRASSLMQEQANTEALVFEEPLQDYVRTTGAVKAALQKRAGKHLTYRTVTGELQGKQAAAARAREQGRTDRYQAAEEEVRVATQKVQASEQDLEVVHRRVMAEMQRFQREKLEDMRHIMIDYVQLQIQQAQKMEQLWRGLLPHVEAIEVPAGAETGGDEAAAAEGEEA